VAPESFQIIPLVYLHVRTHSFTCIGVFRKTSDLIPLCHPIPLDQVQVDIQMTSNREILIDCTCHATHKTGVEMEAMTGASVAALTIYDMVKAVSHHVEITATKLISKTGGKRTIGLEGEQVQ